MSNIITVRNNLFLFYFFMRLTIIIYNIIAQHICEYRKPYNSTAKTMCNRNAFNRNENILKKREIIVRNNMLLNPT